MVVRGAWAHTARTAEVVPPNSVAELAPNTRTSKQSGDSQSKGPQTTCIRFTWGACLKGRFTGPSSDRLTFSCMFL